MNHFISLYNEFQKNSKYATHNTAFEFYEKGIALAKGCETIQEKEAILEKLLEVFPNDPAIHYYIGFANKTENPEKALMHHQTSYDINPDNVENLIDLCDLLLKFDMKTKVLDMNKTKPFGKFLDDWRLLVIYYQCIRETSNSKCLQYIQQVLAYLANKGSHTEKEKEVITSAYSHITNMYSSLSDNKKALEYSEIGIKLAKKYKVNSEIFINSLTNYVFCSNFVYAKSNVQSGYTLLNQLMPKQNKYTYHRREPTDKIRIGYVSSDFIDHAVSNFILPILQNHDEDRFEVVLFPNNIRISEKMMELGVEYHNIFKLTDLEAADLIHRLKIDILVELNGYTGNNRIPVFSYCPAPVQISYLGYPNTLGLDFINYRITDAIADPLDTTQYYSEKLVRLSKCFLLYQPWHQDEPVQPRKTKDTVILGSFNKENKTSPEVLKTWAIILRECPNTKLLIKLDTTEDKTERQRFYKEKLAVDDNRILLITKTDKDAYTRLFGMIDILLDTFPYSGTTTTCNAMYNSIPVVTMMSPNCHAHNVSASLLKNCGLDELVARSQEEYIDIVRTLVNDAFRIDSYKQTIRVKFAELMNPSDFMRSYEGLLFSLVSAPFVF